MMGEYNQATADYQWVKDKHLPSTVERAVPDPADPSSFGFLYRPGELIVRDDRLDEIRRDFEARRPKPRVRRIKGTELSLVTFARFRGPTFFDEVKARTQTDGIDYHYVLVAAFHPSPEPGGAPEPVERPGVSSLPASGPTGGSGVTVAVLDSGDDLPPTTGRIGPFASHGRFIVELVRQSAPGALVRPTKVFGPDGFIDDNTLANAIESVPAGIDILNLSLGGPTQSGKQLPLSQPALRKLLDDRSELIAIASAGNARVNVDWWPANDKHEKVYGVAALNQGGTEGACFTNFGPDVDFCTEGEDLVSTYFTVKGKLTPPPNQSDCFPQQNKAFFERTHVFAGRAMWSGTSFAAARVSGFIAATMEPGKAPQRAAELAKGRRFIDDQNRDLGVRVLVPLGPSTASTPA